MSALGDPTHVVDNLDLRVAHHWLRAAGCLVRLRYLFEMDSACGFSLVNDQLGNGAKLFEIRPNFSEQELRRRDILDKNSVAPLV